MDGPRDLDPGARMELFDSRSVPAEVRTSSWERASARFLVPLRIRADGETVTGVIGTRRVGVTSFCRLRATPHSGVRTPRMAAGTGTGHYKVALSLQSPALITQLDRRVLLRPGDLAVYDTSEAYSVGSELEFGLLIALLPHDALELSRDRVAATAATRLTGRGSEAVRGALLALAEGRAAPARLDQAMGAITALVRGTSPVRAARNRDSGDLLEHAKEVIAYRLADPGLGPAYVAAVLGVSLRRLYTLFAEEVGPVAAYIRTRRLERARGLLLGAEGAGATVTEVALECGFTDPAHFSRLFQQAYGCSPTRFRIRAADRGIGS